MRNVLAKQPVISIQFPRLRVWKSERVWQRERETIMARSDDLTTSEIRVQLRKAAARHVERCQGRDWRKQQASATVAP